MTLNENGVSETIGFVLLLSITVTGITLVTIYGYPALLSEQHNANLGNMERNMISFQNEVKSLVYQSVPYRETTLQIAEGVLSVNQSPGSSPTSPYFKIMYSGNGTSIDPSMPVFYPGELHYDAVNNLGEISLENGAVIVSYPSDPNGSAMISPPRFVYDSNTQTYIVPLIRLNATDNYSRTGISTLQIGLGNYSQKKYDISGKSITLQYHADPDNNHNIAWKDYLQDPTLQMTYNSASSDGFNSYFTLTNAKTLVISQYNVTIQGI